MCIYFSYTKKSMGKSNSTVSLQFLETQKLKITRSVLPFVDIYFSTSPKQCLFRKQLLSWASRFDILADSDHCLFRFEQLTSLAF